MPFSDYKSHSAPLFLALKILYFTKIVMHRIGMEMYKILPQNITYHLLLESYLMTILTNKLCFYGNILNYDLRTDLNLATARFSVITLDQASLCIINNLFHC